MHCIVEVRKIEDGRWIWSGHEEVGYKGYEMFERGVGVWDERNIVVG